MQAQFYTHSSEQASLEHPHLNVNHRLLQLDPTPPTVEVGLESCPKTRGGIREEGEGGKTTFHN